MINAWRRSWTVGTDRSELHASKPGLLHHDSTSLATMTVALLELTLFVTDVDATAQFYQAAGLQLFCVDEPGYPRHYDGELGFQLFPAGTRHTVSHFQMGLVVDDLAASVRQLTAVGAKWTCRFPNFVTTHDPDGNKINLAQRRSA